MLGVGRLGPRREPAASFGNRVNRCRGSGSRNDCLQAASGNCEPVAEPVVLATITGQAPKVDDVDQRLGEDKNSPFHVGLRAALITFLVGLVIALVGISLVVGGAIPRRNSALIIAITAVATMYAIGIYLGIKARKARSKGRSTPNSDLSDPNVP
jgi:hypothetical protein